MFGLSLEVPALIFATTLSSRSDEKLAAMFAYTKSRSGQEVTVVVVADSCFVVFGHSDSGTRRTDVTLA